MGMCILYQVSHLLMSLSNICITASKVVTDIMNCLNPTSSMVQLSGMSATDWTSYFILLASSSVFKASCYTTSSASAMLNRMSIRTALKKGIENDAIVVQLRALGVMRKLLSGLRMQRCNANKHHLTNLEIICQVLHSDIDGPWGTATTG